MKMTSLLKLLRKIGVALRLISAAVDSTKATAEEINTEKKKS